MTDVPYQSISTDDLIKKDIGVDWNRAYHDREQILATWTDKVTQ